MWIAWTKFIYIDDKALGPYTSIGHATVQHFRKRWRYRAQVVEHRERIAYVKHIYLVGAKLDLLNDFPVWRIGVPMVLTYRLNRSATQTLRE